MNKSSIMTVIAIVLSFASFAIAPITGSHYVCVGSTITLADTSAGGAWSSGNTAIASISAGGVVTGGSAGTTNIIYVLGADTATFSLTVNPLFSPITGGTMLCVGSTITLADATPGGSWISGNTAVATVNAGGVVTGIAPGTMNIYYTVGGSTSGCSVYHPITVNAIPSISGGSVVCTGATITLTSTPTGGTWISGNTTMATVSSAGVVTGGSAGVVNIYYTMGSTTTTCVASHLVTVHTSPAISGASTVCAGSTITLGAGPSGGTWSVGDSSVASVSTAGVVTGLSPGVTNIYYHNGDCYAYHMITVNATASISGSSVVCVGSTTTLTGSPAGGTWTSGNTAMASITSAGVVTGGGAGVVNIYYSLGTSSTTCVAQHLVSVHTSPAISGASTVCLGSSITLGAGPSGGTWSVGGSGIATVSTAGIVTGLLPGVTNIYYYNGGCYAYHTVTVNAAASISGSSTVCVGSTTTLTGTPTGGTWTCSNTSMATVSTAGVVTGATAGVVNIYYSLGTSTTCVAEHLVSVRTSPAISGASTICVGSTITLGAGPAGGTWSVANSSIATVSVSGVVSGLAPGITNIYYNSAGCYAYHTVSVNAITSISGPSVVCTGSTTTLTGTPAGGTWISGNTTMATVSSAGVVTGVTAGVVTIYYTLGSTSTTCAAEHAVTVRTSPAISGASVLCAGSTITLGAGPIGGTWSVGDSSIATVNATGLVSGVGPGVTYIYYYSGGCYAHHAVSVNAITSISGGSTVCTGATTTLTGTPTGGTWISSNTAMATVSSAGVVTGVTAGVVNIYYTFGSTSTTCAAAHAVSVHTSPAISGSSTICAGSSITLGGGPSGGTWSVAGSGIATVSTAGVVTGLSVGSTNIYYSVSGCYAYHMVTVSTGASISGASAVCTGSAITLTGAPTGGTWVSGNTAQATVSSAGVVTGITAGVVNIYYILGSTATGCVAEHNVTVNAAAATISGSSSVCAGNSITLTDAVPGGTWSVSGSGIATVSTAGVVTGLSAGVVNIYYLVGGCGAYRIVTVNATPAPITGASTVCAGSTITLTDSITGGSWYSGNTARATVSSAGVVTGIAAGAVTIYYTLGSTSTGCIAEHSITVNAAAAISGASTICSGSAITLTGSPAGGTWSVSGSGIATVSTAGVVTGLSGGTVNVYYSIGGCYAYHPVTVSAAAAISGPSAVCIGSTITLTGTPTGGTWISGNTAQATVSSAGIVTGTTAGVVNIYYTMGSTSTGCVAEHTVTVGTTPSISGTSAICLGLATTLTASPAGGTWSVGASSVATVSTSGVVTSLGAGVTNIYYYSGGCYTYHPVTVNAAASISGASVVCSGSTTTLTGTPGGGVWISGNTSMATVSTTGVVTGGSAGVVNIYYTMGTTSTTCVASHAVSVHTSPAISGASTICMGSTITLGAGPSGGIWSVGDSSIAAVSASGVVSGLLPGVTNVYYYNGGCYAYHMVTVNAAASISGASVVCTGSTVTLTGTTAGGTWTSGNTTMATVSSAGVVTGTGAGVVNIYYSLGTSTTCLAQHLVSVHTSPAISGASSICAGATITMGGGPTGGIWSVGDSSIATVNASGAVTGHLAGITNIYYYNGGCYAYHMVTVNASASISGASVVCTGSTTTLTGTPSGGTWISGNTAMATVSSGGVVSGLTTGVVNIYYTLGSTSTTCAAEHLVSVHAVPTISGGSVTCIGSSISLSGSPAGGTWSASGSGTATVSISGIVTGLATGSGNIYYIAGGCGNYHPVTINALPAAISGDSVVAIGSAITLTETTGGGTWISGNTSLATVSSAGVVTGAEAGVLNIYYTMGTTTSGCIVFHTVTVNPLPRTAPGGDPATSGVTPIFTTDGVNVYPNPAGNLLHIDWLQPVTGQANIIITDMVGREVYRSTRNMDATMSQTQADLSALKDGVYLISINCGNIYYSTKLLIQK